jgi:farnesyl-diphosphate farnesyltransferase
MTAYRELLGDLLKATSRSFYLTLRVLPAAVRPQVGLAYLLARTTDTIADTEIVSVQNRLEALDNLRKRILGESTAALEFGQLKEGCAQPAEKVLLERVEEALRLLDQARETDRVLIRDVLDVITSGQEMDLRRFGERKPGPIPALETEAELDDYTYRVAGCVGEFWTRICQAHLFPNAPVDVETMLCNGIRFGKGLQMVNILRDIPRDLRNGRCYLPLQTLAASGMTPDDLLSAGNYSRLRPLYEKWLALAEAHLATGWNYTNSLPAGQSRLRLACAWPILIGVRTLQKLRTSNPLEPARAVKVTRPEVYGIMARSILCLFSRAAWRDQFECELKQKT